MGRQQDMAAMAKVQQAVAAAIVGHGKSSRRDQRLKNNPQIGTGRECSKMEQFFLIRQLVLKYGSKMVMVLLDEVRLRLLRSLIFLKRRNYQYYVYI